MQPRNLPRNSFVSCLVRRVEQAFEQYQRAGRARAACNIESHKRRTASLLPSCNRRSPSAVKAKSGAKASAARKTDAKASAARPPRSLRVNRSLRSPAESGRSLISYCRE